MRGNAMDTVVDRLRQMLLGNHSQVTARLERELDELRRTLRDPGTIRSLVVEALHEEVKSAPAEIAAALSPALDHLVRERAAAEAPRETRRQWPWLSLLVIACATGLALLNWRGPAAVVSAATERVPLSQPMSAVAPILEERTDGFGLGGNARTDGDLTRDVRARLAACDELIGARVSFSVKDGWVWLRGEASARAHDAATRALADLGDGIVVVNQLQASNSTD